MALGPGLSGVNPNTPNNLILDCGILYKNINLTALRNGEGIAAAIAGAEVLGATRGGATFTTNKESRQVEVDGLRFPIRGMERIDMFRPEMTCTLIELTMENLQLLMGAQTTDSLPNGWNEITPDIAIADGDYLDNIALMATHSGSDHEVVVVLENVLMVDGMQLPFEDKAEVAIACTFRGHATASDPQSNPFHIFYPPTGAVPPATTTVTASTPTEGQNNVDSNAQIVLTFSAALNSGSAQDVNNYSLSMPGSPPTPKALASAVYSATPNPTVTITPDGPMPAGAYVFQTGASIVDSTNAAVTQFTLNFTVVSPG